MQLKSLCGVKAKTLNNSGVKLIILIATLIWAALSAPVHAQYMSIDIVDYQYAQFSSSDEASVDLYGTRGQLFGILIFLPVDKPGDLPAAAQGIDGVIRLYYKRERLQGVIDQLRNETPLVLNYWIGAGGNNSHIGTMREPVGEGEL